MQSNTGRATYQANLRQALMAGAVAGMAVDTALYPLDTIKTRFQSKAGFRASGGFRGIYSGLLSAVVGSAPNASLFFVTYEASKRLLGASTESNTPFTYMVAATFGEISACTVRVPTEVIKQRMQIKQFKSTSNAVTNVLRTEGLLGFYRGFLPTVAREIPFTCIQFPLYEYLKTTYGNYKQQRVEPYEAALMGSLAGGVAAAITTPLDVCKTRIMLSKTAGEASLIETMRKIITEEGAKKLWAGVGPRVMWISIGGSVFLGVYEKAVKTYTQLHLFA
ncbi:hypothetical protein G6F43_012342 [Rhizopus delemar]|nr:hypothetical protein G6F43_012342 [Rhizopus delemar]